MPQAPTSRPEQFNFNHRIPNPLTYTAYNQEQAIQIDRLHGIRSLSLQMTGAFAVTGNNNAVAVAEPNFVQDIRLTVGGGTVLWAGDFNGLFRINQFEYGVTPPFSNGVSGAAGAKTYTGFAVLDLQTVMGRAPVDTALISRLFSSIELRALIGSAANIATGQDGLTFTNFNIDVTLNEVVNLQDGFGRFVKKVSYIEREVTTTQTEFTLPLNTGNMIKNLFIRSFVDGVPSDLVINNVKVMVGGEVLFDEKAANMKGEQLLRDLINTQVAGWLRVNFNPDGILSEGANLSKVAALGCNLVLDVTKQSGTNLVRVYQQEILPIR